MKLKADQVLDLLNYWLEREVFLKMILHLQPGTINLMAAKYYENLHVRRNASHFRGAVIDADLDKKNAELSALEGRRPLNSIQTEDRLKLIEEIRNLQAAKKNKDKVDAPIIACRLCGGYLEQNPTHQPVGFSCRVCCMSFGTRYLQGINVDQVALRNQIHRDQHGDLYKYAGNATKENRPLVKNFSRPASVNFFASEHPNTNKLADPTSFEERELQKLRGRIKTIFQKPDIFRYWVLAAAMLGPRSDALLHRAPGVEPCLRCGMGGFTTMTGTHCVLCRRTWSTRHIDPGLFFVDVSTYKLGSWIVWC